MMGQAELYRQECNRNGEHATPQSRSRRYVWPAGALITLSQPQGFPFDPQGPVKAAETARYETSRRERGQCLHSVYRATA